MRAVNRRLKGEGDPKALDRLATKLVERGLEGDVPAMKEIGDRLDGKPTQAIEGTGDAGALVVQLIRFAGSEGR